MSAILQEKPAIGFAGDDPEMLFGEIEISLLVVEGWEVDR